MVDDSVPCVNELDCSCKKHDYAYALGENLREADLEFMRETLWRGWVSTAFGMLVGMQGYLRPAPNKDKSLKMLRGNDKNRTGAVMPVGVPASIGFKIQTKPARITRNAKTTTIVGTDFAGTVYGSNSVSYEPSANVNLNPIYFNGSQMGTLSRSFMEYRIVNAVIQYVPQVPTSTSGQIVFLSNRNLKNPYISGTTGNFLGRVFSQRNAIATPVWEGCLFEVDVSGKWSPINALVETDFNESIDAEVQVYAQASSAFTAGILLLHYTVEFREPLYTLHATNIPSDINGQLITFADDTAANAVGDTIRLANASASFALWTSGSIFRMVFIQGRSTVPTGPASWALVASVSTMGAITTGLTYSITSATVTMATGTTVYGKFAAGGLILYDSLETATVGDVAGVLSYQTVTTAAGVWAFFVTAIRLGDASLLISQ